jgi:putative ABC transport system permease protein
MSLFSFVGAIEIGLVFALVAIGVFLAFRVLDFPDLTVDGSFPLGAAVTAALIMAGVNPWLATGAALFAGGAAGLATAVLNLRYRIMHLLAGILAMTALFTINLRIMGRPNIALINANTIISDIETVVPTSLWTRPAIALVIVAIVAGAVVRFLNSDAGLAVRATGMNSRMARANGVNTDRQTCFTLILSNAIVALGGALFAQMNGFADVTMGIGTILVGLAAVVVGETVLPPRSMLFAVVGCILGSVFYRLAVSLALEAGTIGLQPSDLNLITATIVALALILPAWRSRRRAKAKAVKVTGAILVGGEKSL